MGVFGPNIVIHRPLRALAKVGIVVGSDEPTFGGSDTLLWSDNFDSYTTVAGMTSGTVSNSGNGPGNELLTPGRVGGKCLRANYAADPGHLQQSVNWLSPWNISSGMDTYSPDTAKIVVQYWFRMSVGGTPAPMGMKWIEYFIRPGTSRWQNGIDGPTGGGWNPYVSGPPSNANGMVWSFNNSGDPTDDNGHNEQAQQPVGPWTGDIADGNWHRWTALLQCSSSSRAGDGMYRAWIDGTKIIDLSASAMGVTPPGGYKPWCYAGETACIPYQPIGYVQFPAVANGTDAGFILDHDDLVIWQDA